jgi:hypothetical protein
LQRNKNHGLQNDSWIFELVYFTVLAERIEEYNKKKETIIIKAEELI